MNTKFARFIAIPVASAGMIGAAALGLAGMANASTTTTQTSTGSEIVATPDTHATPAHTVMPGWRHHHGVGHLYLAQ